MRLNFFVKHSFARRVSAYLIAIISIVFCVVVVMFYMVAREKIVVSSVRHATSKLTSMSQKIDAQLQSVAHSIDNSVWLAAANAKNQDLTKSLLRHNIENNPLIIGGAMAYKPDTIDGKEHLKMIYAFNRGGKIVFEEIAGDYYYPEMDWYRTPKESKSSYWSDPYYDAGAGDVIMATYSYPLVNSAGEVYAIYTADISLLEFTNLVEKMQPTPDSYSFMLSRNGYYITHKKTERILHATIFSISTAENNPDYAMIGRAMLAGESGTHLFNNEKDRSYAIYTPVSKTGWSICTIGKYEALLTELNSVTRSIIIIFFVGIFCLFMFTVLIIKRLVRPLKGFALSAQEIAQGNFSTHLPDIKSEDEMLILHDSFVYMQQSLASYIDELKLTTASKERIESELSIAHKIQMGMLPRIFPPFPEREDVELYATLKPAKEVGGDLYDFFILDEKLYFTIGDVSGKGVPASLFMAVTRTLFRNIARSAISSAEIISQMNEAIAQQNDSNMFVTLFVGILNLQNGELDYCNAGHNPPILVAADGAITLLKSKACQLAVGIFDEVTYTNELIRLDSFTKLFCYTDGVVEAENAEQELYREDRLLGMLSKHRQSEVKSLTERVLESVAEHVLEAEQSDDIAILVINYKNKPCGCMKKSIVITNEIDQITRVSAFIEDLGKEVNLSASTVMNINLAIEEAVTNVILYAYPQAGVNTITLSAECTERELVFMLTDSGTEFDPTQVPDVDITLPVEDRPIGGLGVLLIRKIMDEVTYQRINDENQLKARKKIK